AAAFRPAALDEDQVARGIDARDARLEGKTIEQLEDGWRRSITQRHNGEAVAWLVGARACRRYAAAARRLPSGNKPVPSLVGHQHHVAHTQRIFQNKNQIVLRHWPAGRYGHRALNARIDRIAGTEDIAEDDFGDRRHRGVFEI